MNGKKNETIDLAMSQFLRIINKYQQMHKTAMSFGIDEKLLPGEIHTIEAIGRREGMNLTELAAVLGITKGGASQMVSRLSRKKLLTKTRSKNNDKEVRIELTALGRKACRGHENFHAALYDDFTGYLKKAGDKEVKSFLEILNKAERHIDGIVKNMA